jgi:2-hydroxychromene-2-carboxylate isomerase
MNRPAKPAPPVDFWFDFISPFGYLASLRIDAIAARHGRDVRWHPVLLGVTVLKVMGLKPLMDTPLKGDYAAREIGRYCRRHNVTLTRPLAAPPMNPLPAARAFAWLLQHAPVHARPFARAALHDHWEGGFDLGDAAAVRDSGTRAGVPAATMADATSHPDAAALLRNEVDAAMARGVFGSPFVIVDGEPFFGVDKLELVDEWLARGGW